MIEIRAKDRIFVALVLPLALLGCHWFLVRQPLVKERAALLSTRAGLPDPDMFPSERRLLQGRLAEAEKDLAAARAEKPPEVQVRGTKDDSEILRLQAVVDVFRTAGARLVKSEPVDPAGTCADVLRATGVRPEPAARRLLLDAAYPAFVEALGRFEKERLAVVPAAWSMVPGETLCRWEVTLWY